MHIRADVQEYDALQQRIKVDLTVITLSSPDFSGYRLPRHLQPIKMDFLNNRFPSTYARLLPLLGPPGANLIVVREVIPLNGAE
ncbi:hypothetical protein ACN22W_33180 [Burkholderia theae]|uniref:Uncharacterized protein n=1 Tax=Burkholderia theae TaxID=3143496 RepID=A0ABU9WEQ8_9BURK